MTLCKLVTFTETDVDNIGLLHANNATPKIGFFLIEPAFQVSMFIDMDSCSTPYSACETLREKIHWFVTKKHENIHWFYQKRKKF